MSKKFFISLSLLSGIAAIYIILNHIPFEEILDVFQMASVSSLIGFLLASLGIMLALTWRWKIVLESQGIKIPFHHLFNYRIVGYAVSYLTPSAKLGGEAARAAMLKRHNVKFPKALSSILIDRTLEITFSGVFFFIGVMLILSKFALAQETEIMLLLISAGFMVLTAIFFERIMKGKPVIKPIVKSLRLHKIKKLQITEKKLEDFEKLLNKFYQEDKVEFFVTILISLISWIGMFLEFKFALMVIGIDATFLQIFMIVTFVGFSMLIPIPMALGALEASQLAIFKLLNINPSAGVALAFIIRIRDLIWTILGMGMLSYYGLKISNTIKESYKKSEN